MVGSKDDARPFVVGGSTQGPASAGAPGRLKPCGGIYFYSQKNVNDLIS
jgi:hypothetical protein